MPFIEGCVTHVSTVTTAQYIADTFKSAEGLTEHGVLKVVECRNSDVPQGKVTSLPMAAHCKADETVVMS